MDISSNFKHLIIPNFIKSDEVDEIISHSQAEKKEYRTNRGGNTYCTVAWFPHDHQEFAKITARIDELISSQNGVRFHIPDIAPFKGQYQYTDYHEPGDAYGWHTDYGTSLEALARRRISITIALSDVSEYEGGGFELSDHWGHSSEPNPAAVYDNMLSLTDEERRVIGQRGTLIMFASNRMHKALPVLSGSRKVLVCWVSSSD